jgi:hypothetical protein
MPATLWLSSTRKVAVTAEENDKRFATYSGWKGGEKFTSVAQIRNQHPES